LWGRDWVPLRKNRRTRKKSTGVKIREEEKNKLKEGERHSNSIEKRYAKRKNGLICKRMSLSACRRRQLGGEGTRGEH